MQFRNLAPLAMLVGSTVLGPIGCGIVSKDIDGEARFLFSVDDPDAAYDDIREFDPNENDDVREHRDQIENGRVLEISLELTEVLSTNMARLVAGQVDVRRAGTEDPWINAVANWEGVPLYDDQGQPALGQRVKLELSPAKIDELSKLAFEEERPIEFRISGRGFNDQYVETGPVGLKGEVIVRLAAEFSVP